MRKLLSEALRGIGQLAVMQEGFQYCTMIKNFVEFGWVACVGCVNLGSLLRGLFVVPSIPSQLSKALLYFISDLSCSRKIGVAWIVIGDFGVVSGR